MGVFPVFALLIVYMPGPVLSAGTNAMFQQICRTVQEDIRPFDFEHGFDFNKAAIDVRALPSLTFTMEWDESKVPKERRTEFARARDQAIALWKSGFPDMRPTIGKKGRIRASFETGLPANLDSTGPAGAVLLMSPSPNEPMIDMVIALKRGEAQSSIEATDVRNEVAYAIGAYLGLERSTSPGTAMWRHEGAYVAPSRLSHDEIRTVRENLKIVETLRDAVEKKICLLLSQPQIYAEPTELKMPPALQGDIVQTSFQVFNRGNAKLRFKVAPDCGCFRAEHPFELDPGESALVKVYGDTTEFPGQLDKSLYIYSNDPDMPVKRIPISIRVDPIYRFLGPQNADVLIAGKDGAKTEMFLALDPKQPLEIESVRLDGIPAKVTYEPWSGDLPDPSLNEPAKRRQGYKFNIEVSPNIIPGRSMITLVVRTTHQRFPFLRRSMYVQKGIAALPIGLYFGEIGKVPVRGWILLSRPQINFKILKVESDHPAVTAHAEAVRGNWEYKLVIEFNGKADFGNFAAVLLVHTDDPEQPIINVPVSGLIR